MVRDPLHFLCVENKTGYVIVFVMNLTLPNNDFHTVQAIGESHGLYGNYIGVAYVFEKALEATALQQALDALLAELPHLNSTYQRKEKAVKLSADRLMLETHTATGRAVDFAVIGKDLQERSAFIHEPSRKAVQAGRAPMMTIRQTDFDGGGSILGMAIHHILVDAAGFHKVMRRLAEIYTALCSGEAARPASLVTQLDVLSFGTHRTKTETLLALKEAGLSRPMKLTGPLGGFMRRIIIHALDRITGNKRVVIVLSAQDVARLKETVLEESGEDWVSTNVALSAHFLRIMARLMYGDKPQETVRVGQLIDLRGRFFKQDTETQEQFISNAILIHTDQGHFEGGIQSVPRGSLARFLKQGLGKIDGEFLRQRLNLITDTLRHGYSYVGLELKNPLIALNNQSKMPVYDLAFAGQTPARIIPQDVGDNIMFFPTPDGGIEVYIRDIMNPSRQEKLLTPDWQNEIYDF